VQALSLQRLKVIPDKFIHMSIRPSHSIQKKKQKIHDEHPSIYGEELDRISSQIYSDYDLNINQIRQSFNQFIFEYDAIDKTTSDITKDLARMLKLRYKSDAPRRPPRVILLGPPGSGRST